MLENLFNLTPVDSLSLGTVIFNIVLAFVLSLLIAITYKSTHKGLSYSQSFNLALILIGILIAVIMMVIGNSVALAFGAFGTFSLIRFRTAIKDSKDISFVLLVVAVGLASGTGNYVIAIVTTLFTILIIYVLTKINFGSIRKYDYVLSFSTHTNQFSNDKMRSVFSEFLKYDNLLNVASREGGQVLDYSFNIKFINSTDIEKFTQRLSQTDGVYDVVIVSAKNDIEY